MAQHAQLEAETRTMLGKKVRSLRRDGKLPATVYGHNVQPVSIQVDARSMRDLLRKAGRTGLIDLTIDGGNVRPVFVKQTAVDAKRNALLHVEFYQANMREKLRTQVPVHYTGDSQAVKDGGILLTLLDHVEIESLPDDVPAGGLDVDLSQLLEVNAALHVSDIVTPEGVEIVTPADEVLAKVDPPITEEAVEAALAEPTELPSETADEETAADTAPEA